MSGYRFKKPPVIASIAALTSIAILGNLGLWQAKKYQAKTLYNSETCAQNNAPVMSGDYSAIAKDSLSFCPGKARFEGTLDTAQSFRIGPRVQDGNFGYHHYAVLRGADQGGILVNLGWSAQESFTLPITAQKVSITGNLINPGKPSMLAMKNVAEDEQWQTLDVAEITAHYGIENIAPYVVIAQEIEPEITSLLEPSELANSYLTPQTHLQYAAFWFLMAVALSVIFVLRFMTKKESA